MHTQELFSIVDTAQTLGIGRSKIYELLKVEELKAVKVGARTLITRGSIEQFLERLLAA
jgi:excisionase family DNA binding protein